MILSLTLFLIGILVFVLNNQLVKYAYLCTLILSELNTIDLLIIGFFAIFIIAKLLYIFSYRIKSLDCYITVLLNGFLSLSNNKEVSTFCLILALFSGLLGTAFSIFIDLTLSGPDVQYIADNQLYNSIITAHAIFMIFFMIIPALIGGFGNFIYSLMRVDYLPSNNIHPFFSLSKWLLFWALYIIT